MGRSGIQRRDGFRTRLKKSRRRSRSCLSYAHPVTQKFAPLALYGHGGKNAPCWRSGCRARFSPMGRALVVFVAVAIRWTGYRPSHRRPRCRSPALSPRTAMRPLHGEGVAQVRRAAHDQGRLRHNCFGTLATRFSLSRSGACQGSVSRLYQVLDDGEHCSPR